MLSRSGDVIHPQLWESGSGYETKGDTTSFIKYQSDWGSIRSISGLIYKQSLCRCSLLSECINLFQCLTSRKTDEHILTLLNEAFYNQPFKALELEY